MRPFTHTITVAEALERLLSSARPIRRTERVALANAAGRVCAEPIVASFDVPPFDRAAMDGYAVRASDTLACTHSSPVLLRLAGVTYTGEAPQPHLASGDCIEIATGAPVPQGADAVVMVERTRRTADGPIEILERARPGQNIAKRGGDIARESTVLREGDVLTPARLGVLAAAGVHELAVRQRPLIVLASTGNEVVAPGSPLGPGQIYDVNSFTLPALMRAHGADVRLLPAIPDEIGALGAAIDGAADADAIVFTGGSSVGERDLVIDVVRQRGEVAFHGVAMKPGKPTLFARLMRDTSGSALSGEGTVAGEQDAPQLFLGLSGNPTSCLSNGYVLLVPLLRAMAGLPEWQPQRISAPLAVAIPNTAGRHLFYPVRLEQGRVVGAFKGSGEITSLSEAVGYIEIPADIARVEEGTNVVVTIF